MYNGHKNWNHWNVSLWVNNEEPLYRLSRDCLAIERKSLTRAAKTMLELLHAAGDYKTPDGAPYSVSSLRAAMRD